MTDPTGPPSAPCRGGRQRLYLFVACLTTGIGVAVAGSAISGSDWWYLAIPVAIAIPWMFLANPEQCLRRPP
jgi:hypothetical protein